MDWVFVLPEKCIDISSIILEDFMTDLSLIIQCDAINEKENFVMFFRPVIMPWFDYYCL